MNWINSGIQTAATTFAFSSVFILLQYATSALSPQGSPNNLYWVTCEEREYPFPQPPPTNQLAGHLNSRSKISRVFLLHQQVAALAVHPGTEKVTLGDAQDLKMSSLLNRLLVLLPYFYIKKALNYWCTQNLMPEHSVENKIVVLHDFSSGLIEGGWDTATKYNNKTSHVKYENSGELSKQTIDKIVNFWIWHSHITRQYVVFSSFWLWADLIVSQTPKYFVTFVSFCNV